MSFKRHLFVPDKQAYIKSRRRPGGSCILCAILADDPHVARLMIWQDDLISVCANLYPYSAGHLLVFPLRHIVDPRELTDAETLHWFEVTKRCLRILDALYEPFGYNLGCNIGEASGASIDHLHQHIVPRYPKELGFVDITAGAKIIIEDPSTTMERLREGFSSIA